MMILSTVVGGYAVALVASGFRLVPAEIAGDGVSVALRAHIVAAGIALLVGPWQFATRLRRRHPGLHRAGGLLYLTGCLAGGIAGGLSALGTTSGPVAGAGFLLLAVAWVSCTVIAFARILAGNVPAHRRWMMRSFALTLAAVTLRLYLGVAQGVGVGFDSAYPVIAWACWVPNLLIVEWWVRRRH